MSKRKSRAKSMFVDKADLVFEDDSDPEIVSKILNDQYSKASDAKKAEMDNLNVRISNRAKKQKKFYDPSDFNGPVHKKKREAMEQAQLLAESKKKPLSPTKSSTSVKPPATKTPSKTPVKTISKVQTSKSSPAIAKTANDVKKKLVMEKAESVVQKAVEVATAVPVQVAKEAPKRGGPGRKKLAAKKPMVIVLDQEEDAASSSANSVFEKASTVEVNEEKKVPDVTKWTSMDVFKYFVDQGFDKRDAMRLKEQEIDGEALLILNRNDLKDLQLKVGTFVKMWNRILTFQTGSNDFTQGWK